AVLAGDPVALDDLGEIAKNLRHLLHLAGNRPNSEPGGERQAQRLRIDLDRVALNHARFLKPPDPLGYARRGKNDFSIALRDADTTIVGERGQDAPIELVQDAIFIS